MTPVDELQVPPHAHITVDEETYWGLMYLHQAVQACIRAGEQVPEYVVAHSNEAERRLDRTRLINDAYPNHHLEDAS